MEGEAHESQCIGRRGEEGEDGEEWGRRRWRRRWRRRRRMEERRTEETRSGLSWMPSQACQAPGRNEGISLFLKKVPPRSPRCGYFLLSFVARRFFLRCIAPSIHPSVSRRACRFAVQSAVLQHNLLAGPLSCPLWGISQASFFLLSHPSIHAVCRLWFFFAHAFPSMPSSSLASKIREFASRLSSPRAVTRRWVLLVSLYISHNNLR